MSVRIRMKKMGRRHRPFYRICAMDGRAPRNGRVLEELGTYEYSVEAWIDRFASWRGGLAKKVQAGLDVGVELQEGRQRRPGPEAGWSGEGFSPEDRLEVSARKARLYVRTAQNRGRPARRGAQRHDRRRQNQYPQQRQTATLSPVIRIAYPHSARYPNPGAVLHNERALRCVEETSREGAGNSERNGVTCFYLWLSARYCLAL